MPRLNTVNPESDTCKGAEILNGPLKEKQLNIFKGLAAHPTVLQAFLGWSQSAKGGALTAEEWEVVQLLAAEKMRCDYCLAAHTTIAKGIGMSEEESLGIRKRESDDPKLQALIQFTAEVLDTYGCVSDETLATFLDAGYNSEAAIEVAASISTLTFTSLYNHINETVVDFPEAVAL